MSWAKILQAEPEVQAVTAPPAPPDAKSVAVVDTNAVIAGIQLHTLAEQLITVPEVLVELRDARSRQALDALPCSLHVREPSEESLRAVIRFARATGELHSLSAVDLKVVALAYELELATHGNVRLRSTPAPPRPHAKRSARGTCLPGWGDTGGEWAQLDALADEEAAAAERSMQEYKRHNVGLWQDHHQIGELSCWSAASSSGASRIADAVQTLSLGDSRDDINRTGPRAEREEHPEASHGWSLSERSADEGASAEEDDSEDDDSGWQTAPRSAAAARRARRKQARWERRQAAAQAPEAAPAVPAEPLHRQAAAQGVNGAQPAKPEPERASGQPMTGQSAPQRELLGGADEASGNSSEMDSTIEEEEDVSRSEKEKGDEEGLLSASGESSVACVTADFAMQNVLLQMGLRLVAPTGARIRELRRWALRCSACFCVTKEAGRMFCPQCGNASLDKVEVVVSEGGLEQFGVRKRHVLRGTRFSLPKPAGGKNCRDPILREDVLLQRMPHLRAKPAEAADAFAPEYGTETWHQKGAAAPAHTRSAAAAMATWRRNPNERSHARTNRRKR